MNRVIVAISGGLGSAWCAYWAVRKYGRNRIVLYFNDTKWEHPDLYRFLNDISSDLNIPITEDSDGRTPEEIFYKERMLGNNLKPLCSKILKADRLKAFYQDGDILIFGIGRNELHRAHRLVSRYQALSATTGKYPYLEFPLINAQHPLDLWSWTESNGIAVPELYQLGFSHNNCYGGCVRAGKKQWRLLRKVFPKVYLDRERVEREISEFLNRRVTVFKDESLTEFRQRIDGGRLSRFYQTSQFPLFECSECVGICDSLS